MKFLGRRALNLADDLWELVDQIEKDEQSIRSDGDYGYISDDEIDVLNDATNILLEYGRMRVEQPQ